jgi:hypothetical protein
LRNFPPLSFDGVPGKIHGLASPVSPGKAVRDNNKYDIGCTVEFVLSGESVLAFADMTVQGAERFRSRLTILFSYPGLSS